MTSVCERLCTRCDADDALEILATAARYGRGHIVRRDGGVAAVLQFMQDTVPHTVAPQTVLDACDVLACGDVHDLKSATPFANATNALACALDWHTSDAKRLFAFARTCTFRARAEFRGVQDVVQRLSMHIFRACDHRDASVVVSALDTFANLLDDTDDAWWTRGGAVLLANVVERRLCNQIVEPVVLRTLSTLPPMPVTGCRVDAAVDAAVSMDAFEHPHGLSAVAATLARHPWLRAALLKDPRFVRVVVVRAAMSNGDAPPALLHDVAGVVANHPGYWMLYDALYRNAAEAHRHMCALVLLRGGALVSVAAHLPAMLAYARARTQMGRKIDADLEPHVRAVLDDPSVLLMAASVGVEGGDPPGGLVLHLIDTIVGAHRLTGRTRCDRLLRAYLRENLASVADATGVLREHCVAVSLTHGIAPVPASAERLHDDDACRCPITLEAMHCPVVASDGHSYELSALLRLPGPPRTSPMTRRPLHRNVYLNRALIAPIG